jgi:hypothetical protein
MKKEAAYEFWDSPLATGMKGEEYGATRRTPLGRGLFRGIMRATVLRLLRVKIMERC